jgi:hypothetical protein
MTRAQPPKKSCESNVEGNEALIATSTRFARGILSHIESQDSSDNEQRRVDFYSQPPSVRSVRLRSLLQTPPYAAMTGYNASPRCPSYQIRQPQRLMTAGECPVDAVDVYNDDDEMLRATLRILEEALALVSHDVTLDDSPS